MRPPPSLLGPVSRVPARALSSSAPVALEAVAESSRPSRAGESAEDSWRRNLDEARQWRRRAAATRATMPLYLPPSAPTPAPSARGATLSTLLASGAALGHAPALLAPPYVPYIYGNRAGLSIIDLEQTLPLLRRAAQLVRDVVKNDGVVLFVGTRAAHAKIVRKAAQRLGDNGYAVGEWMPGTLTNSETYFGMDPVEKRYSLPDLVVLLNPSENLGAIRECTARNVPTVGIVDTDTDPRVVTYPIPANMESARTAELVAATLSIAGREGREDRVREAAERERTRGRDRAAFARR
ncbi:hypothetical protein Q5752_004439 [Cryptotrichosporon argae]